MEELIVPNGLLPRMWFIVENYRPMFLEGLKYTLIISLLGTLFGVLVGMVLVTMKLQKVTERDSLIVAIFKKLSVWISTAYVDVVRGTPMMIQAIILYYGFLYPVFKLGFLPAGLFIVSLNTAAYATEVLRGSIQAIDVGQMEAARSLGLSNKQAMMKVVLPQALKNSVPAIGNELVINIKDSSVLSVIGVIELMYQSRAAASQFFLHVESAMVAAVMYLILTMSATRILEFILNRTNNPNRPDRPNSVRRKRNALVSIPTSQSFTRGAKW